MKEKRIGILALQETHLSDTHVDKIHKLYRQCLRILHSTLTMNSGGVAFVLNRELINTKDINITTIEQGRAITLTLKWHLTSQMTLLNVYAPMTIMNTPHSGPI